MPTSAPGSKRAAATLPAITASPAAGAPAAPPPAGRPRPPRARRRGPRPLRVARRERAFTLIEMLVVLLIAGLLIAAVTLAPSRNRRTELSEEAQRLASLLESAGDEAQVRSLPIAWQPVNGGYRFMQRTENGEWRTLGDEQFRPRRWGTEVTGVAIRYSDGGKSLSRVVIGDESIDAPVTITLSSESTRLEVVSTGIGNFIVRRP
ncbi:GspH/FimT family pseudopilin [Burkholderia plantarii]|uniref:GspH/FimT family pseudopilin n=1 Tax=Burkholderia plantarii TaxID=41899 RepID=UPI0018DDB918|nr:GspH/FimT family pseudopilin [Burkholderia plantarii]MBI0329119.1 GspH/FimT family pseudopilin [Burkholderia plantarii]